MFLENCKTCEKIINIFVIIKIKKEDLKETFFLKIWHSTHGVCVNIRFVSTLDVCHD